MLCAGAPGQLDLRSSVADVTAPHRELDGSAADSPASVFARAQRAIAAGDWEGFFACLDAGDLRRLASMLQRDGWKIRLFVNRLA
jgi:hypothetical protein